ncbi:hypothetical protein [Virgibacillus necropolis]|uniref:Uncharacterized protein n=1 Tax=Virgibacillus necropolis TaxID=163877 RepID=A0A221MGT9_9BACI|nr:hypothetical protein [Virgibacillus necropolis]ASN06854.1 hypothetical protein CFK40_18415 [Virgibacillus necropolis]
MTGFVWISGTSKPSNEEVIEAYERSKSETEQLRKDVVKRYYASHNLPYWAVNKVANIRFSEKEFIEILAKLQEEDE